MTKRSDAKQAARLRILDSGAALMRAEGLDGAAVAAVMGDAGLTHGAFYAHFKNKSDLAQKALRHALGAGRSQWTQGDDQSWAQRLKRLARSYLTADHRENRGTGCAFAALGGDAARAADDFRDAYGEELAKTIETICAEPEAGPPCKQREDDAILLMALCVGGMTLARGVGDADLSNRILELCAKSVADDSGGTSSTPISEEH